MPRAWPVADIEPDGPVALNARRILAVRVAELYSWEPAVERPEAVEPLHAMRISAKRLRYSLELFADVFGEGGKRALERVKEIQELLGTLHDTDVRIDLIAEELEASAVEHSRSLGPRLAASSPADHRAIVASALRPPPDDPRRGLVSLLSRQHAERRAVYDRFVERWAALQVGGMRRELVELSTPLVGAAAVPPGDGAGGG